MTSSWIKSITSPFRKSRKQQHRDHHQKPQQQGHDHRVMELLHGEVMACGYEDVQVMWSILDKSKSPGTPNRNAITSS